LNLKTEEGRRILWKLIERADVVIENFRPGVLAKLGFGYEPYRSESSSSVLLDLRVRSHRPLQGQAGYDVIAQGSRA